MIQALCEAGLWRDGWHFSTYQSLEDTVRLHSLGITVPMKGIYRNVSFED